MRLRQSEAERGILAEWRNWAKQPGAEPLGAGAADAFYQHLLAVRDDLLTFGGRDDKAQTVRIWLTRNGLIGDGAKLVRSMVQSLLSAAAAGSRTAVQHALASHTDGMDAAARLQAVAELRAELGATSLQSWQFSNRNIVASVLKHAGTGA
jgi:hypothetical protein